MKKILYIGNNLSEKTSYQSAMATLTKNLANEGFLVVCSSDKQNKFFRLLDMCFSVIKYRNDVDYLLIDTFSTQNFYYALITSQLARIFNLKYIPILHGGALPKRLKKTPFFSKLLFNNSYKNIAPSQYLANEFSVEGFTTKYIPNSIDVKEVSYKERTQIQPKLLWVRAFDEIYNPFLAIKIVNLLKKEFPEVQLCMVGPDKDGTLSKIKTMVEKFDLVKNVIFTGVLKKEQWFKLSEQYDIFMNTTNVDNMPVSIIEAMALGFPIVSTNIGGLPFLIENDVDGLLIEPNDEKLFAKTISNLIKNPEKVSQLSHNARLKAESFDSSSVINQWKNVLK